jgi:hypothetical protein
LADALDLGSSAVKGVQVQVLFPAPANLSLFADIAATHAGLYMGGAALQRCVLIPDLTSALAAEAADGFPTPG